ncbi:SRPBCC family protein [Vibrio ziniensis]|uniref:ATPase n=1 Tax=Vibrio ziniensis TaxID=2711221 RepID=A0A6G7CIF7_9VIBR|nr:SRPBCC family protein [Vibrio ziniensis]QIH41895.1 ATPase [Vibrio ziniensis]
MKIHISATVNAPKDKVWQAYTTPEDIVQWNAASDDWHTTEASVDLRVGGQFCSRMEAKDGSFGFDFAGTYTNVEVGHLIEYEFGGRTAQVVFADEATGTRIDIKFDPEDENPIDMQIDGWQAILNNFKCHVESQQS